MRAGSRWLWVVLLATVIAAIWPVEEKPADSVAGGSSADRHRGQPRGNTPPPPVPTLTASKPVQESEIADLFPRQGWTPPAVSAVPAAPAAPPLPFTFGGRYTEGTKIFIFLTEGAKMHAVREGDTVNATYRIEKIDPAAITLTYLPLGLQQILPTGSTTSP